MNRAHTPNPIAVRRAQLLAAGLELTDLTDTNPTRYGLFDPQILDIAGAHLSRAGRYEPHPRGPWPARAALAERYGGDPEDYWLVSSTSEAYGWLFTLLADPGDSIAIPSPGYPLIEPLAQFQSLTTSSYRTFYVHPAGWELDRESLEEILCDNEVRGSAVDRMSGSVPTTRAVVEIAGSPMTAGSRVRAIVAVNPNNPTGSYADPVIADMAAEHGLPLIADEVFFPFHLGDGPTPIRLSGNETSLTFGLDGLSKLLAAPQLKLGWIRLSGPSSDKLQAAEALDEIADAYLSVNTPVALALPDLLNLADSSIARITARLKANLTTAQNFFTNTRIRTTHGGWMMLLDVPPLMDADDLCVALMDRAALYVHPGYYYDLPDSTLALSLLPDPPIFEESCHRLAAAFTLLVT